MGDDIDRLPVTAPAAGPADRQGSGTAHLYGHGETAITAATTDRLGIDATAVLPADMNAAAVFDADIIPVAAAAAAPAYSNLK